MQPATQKHDTANERFFEWLEKLLRERKDPDGAFQKCFRRLRAGLTFLSVAYLIGLILLLFFLDWQGERNWLLSILLFAPSVIWLAPLLVLVPLQIFLRPKLCWLSAAAIFALLFVHMDFNWSFASRDSKKGLSLLTNNVGGRKFATLAKFLEKEDPDIIALQDTARISGLARQYPERFVANVGQFILVSKIPIRESGALSDLKFQGRPIGAWHELQYKDQSIVIYNIHMPTPRREFSKLRGRGFIAEIFSGSGIFSRSIRNEYQSFLDERTRLTLELRDLLQEERRPFLVAGDFNMPSNGYFHDLLASNLKDAFRAKGRGYGFTFPGTWSGALRLFGSWLRIDYLFANKNWDVKECHVEPGGVSEHRAVIARFELNAKPHKP